MAPHGGVGSRRLPGSSCGLLHALVVSPGALSKSEPQGHRTSRLTPQCGQRSAGFSFRPEGAKPLARFPNIPPMSPPHFGHGNLLANAAQATRHTAPTAIVKRRVSASRGSKGGRAKPKKAIATRVVFDQKMRRLSRPRIVSAMCSVARTVAIPLRYCRADASAIRPFAASGQGAHTMATATDLSLGKSGEFCE